MNTNPSKSHELLFYIVTIIVLTALSYVMIYDGIQQYRYQKSIDLYTAIYQHIKEKIESNDLNFEPLLSHHIDDDISYQLMIVMPVDQPYVHQYTREEQSELEFFTLPNWHTGNNKLNYYIKRDQLLGYSDFGDGYQIYLQTYHPPATIDLTRFIYWLPLIAGLLSLLIGLNIYRRRIQGWRVLMGYLDELPKRIYEPYKPIRFQDFIKEQDYLRLGNALNRINYRMHHGQRCIQMLLSRIERTVKYAPLPILLVKRNGQISFFNKRFEQVFMTTFEESVSYYLTDFLMGVDKSTQMTLTKLDNERTSSILNVTSLERNNSDYQLHLTPWFGKQGQVQGFCAILNNVSHFTQTISDMRIQITQKQEKLNEFDKLWSVLGHELRTPLSGILGLLALMNQDNFTPDQQETYTTLEQTSKTMLAMLNDMLDVAKLEAGKLQIINERTDILALCLQVTDLMSSNARHQNIELLCHFDPQCPRYFTTDSGRLRQALLNLLSNAIKFTKNGYVALTIRHYSSDNTTLRTMLEQSERYENIAHVEYWICFNIEDTGIGISAQDLQKLFSHFNQANESISRQFGGTGLGLAISNNFAHLLGGFIHVDSDVGRGSTFSLCLPINEMSYQPVYQFNTDLSGLYLVAFTSQDISTKAYCELSNHLDLAATVSTGITHDEIDKLNQRDFGTLKPIILIEYELYEHDNIELINQLTFIVDTPKILVSMTPERGVSEKIRESYDAFLLKPLNVNSLITELIRLSYYSSKDNTLDSRSHSSKVQQSFERFMLSLHGSPSSDNNKDTTVTNQDTDDIGKNKDIDMASKPSHVKHKQLKSDNSDTSNNDTSSLPKITLDTYFNDSALILVAEDNSLNQKIVSKLLSQLGYRCLLANDGKEALDYMNTHRDEIDLILMDCRMPITDGLEATRKIRAKKDPIPIIALTANDTDVDRQECLQAGMNSFLSKPINKDKLESMLKKFIVH